MAHARRRRRARRVRNRDAVALSILSSALLFAGEVAGPANPGLRETYDTYLAPHLSEPAVFVLNAILAVFAFTTAFGAILVLLGGWYFMHGKIPRGRFLLGLGIGLTSVGLVNRIAYSTLALGSPLVFLAALANTFTGIGILIGVIAHALMGQYALMLKRHALLAWRRWRRSRRLPRRPIPPRPTPPRRSARIRS